MNLGPSIMLELSIVIATVLGGVLFFQVLFSKSFVSLYKRPQPETLPEEQLPYVLLVLPLRGADPFLNKTLWALFHLNYPRYDLRIVVDSIEDPAWQVVQDAITAGSFENVRLIPLKAPLKTCGLKVSALLQEFIDLDPKYDVVSWIDADVVPYPDWLRDLVTPLAREDVGATTGIRWYLPNPDGWGTVVRSLWNTGAIIQMFFFKIAFGGSIALKASTFRESDLLQAYSRMLWEDTYLYHAVQRVGKRLEFVPAATMANHETISMRGCFRFICRQVLNARLYHKSWKWLLSFGLVSSIGPCLGLVFSMIAATRGEIAAALIAGLATGLFVVGIVLLYAWSGSYVNRAVRKRREPNWRFPIKVVLAAPLTIFVYLASLGSVLFKRRIEWRGVEYEIRKPLDIELIAHTPYHPPHAATEQPDSI
jgi:cellulose synthase/poly-beta-1,6-N-acetylglucosamine synthase-like glycosyltransferase